MLSRSRHQLVMWVFAFANAVLFTLSFPPFDFWFLAFLAPAPLALLAINARSMRWIMLSLFVTQFAMWMWLLRWIIPVTDVGYPFLALYMSVWMVILAWIIRRISRHRIMNNWPMTFVLPVCWVGVEYFRGDVLFYGYPWYLLGHPLIAAPVLTQSADLFGTCFISFLAAMISGAMIDLIHTAPFGRSEIRHGRTRLNVARSVVALIVIWAANLAYGFWRMNQTGSLSPGPLVLAIQTNLPQDNKTAWSVEAQARDVQQFMAMTREALARANPRPDVIVWPETMVPGTGFEAQTISELHERYSTQQWDVQHLYRWPLGVSQFQDEIGVPLLVGSEAWVNTVPVQDGTKVRLEPMYTYNSAYLIQGEPPYQRYDKFFLTPFGETMPYISAWPWLEQQLLALGARGMQFNLDSNPDVAILQLESSNENGRRYRLATPICFEDTVARFCRRMIYHRGEKRADIIVNISNDGWFNVSIADRKLHAMSARFRSIENRVPVVRSVNTGLSVHIDSTGRLLRAVGGEDYGQAMQSGSLLADVKIDSRRTLYAWIGELWPTSCLFATVACLVWTVLARTAAPKD